MVFAPPKGMAILLNNSPLTFKVPKDHEEAPHHLEAPTGTGTFRPGAERRLAGGSRGVQTQGLRRRSPDGLGL